MGGDELDDPLRSLSRSCGRLRSCQTRRDPSSHPAASSWRDENARWTTGKEGAKSSVAGAERKGGVGELEVVEVGDHSEEVVAGRLKAEAVVRGRMVEVEVAEAAVRPSSNRSMLR